MRIVGGHDYYDGVLPFDADQDRVFVRAKREVALPPVVVREPEIESYVGSKHWRHELAVIEVIFCGKRYRGLKLSREKRLYGGTLPPVYLWSPEKLNEYATVQERPRAKWLREDRVFAEDLPKFFAPEQVTGALFNRLVNDKILVAISPARRLRYRDDDPWLVNGTGLKDIGFGSVVPPWEAYQELDMFLGTILVGDEDRMVRVSDEVKRDKYGFDKWSFKNSRHPAKPRGGKAA